MQQEYTPYGPEWAKEIKKLTKDQIIDNLLRPALLTANAEPWAQSAGTWVKASERLPEKDSDPVIVKNIYNGRINRMRNLGNICGWGVGIDADFLYYNTVWLDESQSALPSSGLMATGNYEKEWEDFWKEIVCNPDGSINVEQVKKELSDFSFVIEQVPKVYCHITDSLLSKVMYTADTVIRVADDRYNKVLQEELKEAAEDADTLPDNKDREQAIGLLKTLCDLKQYKDATGKDEYYEENKERAWDNAFKFLESLTNNK